MAYRRTIAVLLASAVVATACRDGVSPSTPSVPDVRLGQAKGHPASETLENGLRMGQCFLQIGISAPQITPPSDGATAFIAPAGQVITRVSIKAGPTCWITPENVTGTHTFEAGGAPCYVVAGLGTQLASAARVGSGPDCPVVGTLQYLAGSAAPPADDTTSTGSGDTGGGDTGGPTGPGAIVLCAAVSQPTGMEWYFDYDIGTMTSVSVREGDCSSPITLDAGDYDVAERVSSDMPLTSVTSDPADRVLTFSLASGATSVRVVPGSTTTVTFGHTVP